MLIPGIFIFFIVMKMIRPKSSLNLCLVQLWQLWIFLYSRKLFWSKDLRTNVSEISMSKIDTNHKLIQIKEKLSKQDNKSTKNPDLKQFNHQQANIQNGTRRCSLFPKSIFSFDVFPSWKWSIVEAVKEPLNENISLETDSLIRHGKLIDIWYIHIVEFIITASFPARFRRAKNNYFGILDNTMLSASLLYFLPFHHMESSSWFSRQCK